MKKFTYLNVPDHWQVYYSKYPEGHTIIEALIDWTSHVNKMTDNLNDMNYILDNFLERFDMNVNAEVRSLLDKWSADGTLEKIINEEVFEGLNNKIDSITQVVVSDIEPQQKNNVVWYEVLT